MKVHVLQSALPEYRIDFFEKIHLKLSGFCNFEVYYSTLNLGRVIDSQNNNNWSKSLGGVKNFKNYILWQQNVSTIKFEPGDILVLSGAPRYISNIYLFIKAKLKSVKVVWWGHYKSPNQKSIRFYLRYFFMQMSDANFFYTQKELKLFNARTNSRNRHNSYFLNNGIKTSEINLLRNKFLPHERPNEIIFIGRLTEKSEILILVQAISHLEVAGFKLNVLGSGPKLPELKRLIKDTGNEKKVILWGEETSEKTIAKVMNRCRLFVYPGSVGLSLIHAMAYGIPTIVHDDEKWQMPEYAAFKNQHTGCAFSKGNSEHLRQIISENISDEQKLSFLSKNCLKILSETHNTDDMSDRFVHAIHDITEN